MTLIRSDFSRWPEGVVWAGCGVLASLLVASACFQTDGLPLASLVREGDAYIDPSTREPYSGPVFASFGDAPSHVERRASLVEGRYDGPFELYFANRRVSVREVYKEGQKDGPYEWYLENGDLYEKGTYENGLREGPYEAYFQDGRLFERGTYRHGDFDGPREWYLESRLIERVTYVRGQIDGPYERYAPDGTVELQGMLRYGNPCGPWNESGTRVVYPTCGYVSD